MTEALQDKIYKTFNQTAEEILLDPNYKDYETRVNKAIQELREEIIKLVPDTRFSNLREEDKGRAIAYVKVLALIGEKK